MTRKNSNGFRIPVQLDRRRCQRLHLSFPIQVSGTDTAGQPFCERTVTGDVSDEGCSFEFLREVRCGDTLRIKLVPRKGVEAGSGHTLLFEVAWVETSEWGWAIGACKLQPENIWHMAFPQKDPSAP